MDNKVTSLIDKMNEVELRSCLRASYTNPTLITYRSYFRERLKEKGVECRLVERMERDFKRIELGRAA